MFYSECRVRTPVHYMPRLRGATREGQKMSSQTTIARIFSPLANRNDSVWDSIQHRSYYRLGPLVMLSNLSRIENPNLSICLVIYVIYTCPM